MKTLLTILIFIGFLSLLTVVPIVVGSLICNEITFLTWFIGLFYTFICGLLCSPIFILLTILLEFSYDLANKILS
jgi:hypothetical protein